MSRSESLALKILALVAFFELASLAVFGYIQMSGFEELFKDFDRPLPLLTGIYISTYKYWGLLALFPAFVIVRSFKDGAGIDFSFGPTVSLIVGHMLLGVIVFVAGVYAMYLPIFELSNAR